jgi:AcrR family transcriptional regulator
MEEVAARARVSKGTLYRYFESKEDLFLATLIDSYQRGLRILDTHVETDGDPRERLGRQLDGLTEVLAATAPRMQVHYQAWGVITKDEGFQNRLYSFLRDFHAQRGDVFRQLLREGQRAGVIRADADVVTVADGIQALLSGFLYRATFDPAQANPTRLRACFEVLLRDVTPERPARRAPRSGEADG